MKKILLIQFFLLSAILSVSAQQGYYSGTDRYYGGNDYSYNNRNRQNDYSYNSYGFSHGNSACHRQDQYHRNPNSYHNGNNNYGSYGSRPRMLSDENFRMLRNYIAGLSFDSDRLHQAEQAVRNNGTSSSQVRELMQLLTFESTKLDFAKFAFPYVADKGMYFVVNDAFTFSSSRDELDNYLLAHGY